MTVEIKKQKFQKSFQDFEARQNAVGFFDLLLKIDKRNNYQTKIIKTKLSFKIPLKVPLQFPISIVFLIFAILFILKNECLYSLVCLIFLFPIINDQKLKKLTIKRDGFNIEFFNSEK